MCGVLKFRARANAGQCELSDGTRGNLSNAVGEAVDAAREGVIRTHSLLKDGNAWEHCAALQPVLHHNTCPR